MSASPPALKDPYQYDPAAVEEPPRGLFSILRRIGPGMILAASIVGSGELIATTTLGAEAGYTALWVILISCFLKPALQAELGRFCIATGETGLAGLTQVPGPRAGLGWVVWAWVGMILMTRFQIGAMFGGVAQVLNILIPGVHVNVWVVVLLGVTLALLLGGGYERIEGLATIKVGLFTMLTLMAALLLIRHPQDFNWDKLMQGLNFDLPKGGLATAVAVFGITGVGAAELIMYPYWCVEKGYAQFTGRQDGSEDWKRRARGWVRVMHFDILATMVIYTVATLAFYLLGAGILNSRGMVPKANDMIPVLSRMYTETLGSWVIWLFYAGAIATLYGTIFAATAAESRVFADLCRLLGKFRSDDYPARIKYRQRFVWILTVVPAFGFMLIQSPVNMVKAGGVAQACMLPVIAVGTLYLRYRKMPRELHSPVWMDAGLWIASVAIFGMIGYYLYLLVA